VDLIRKWAEDVKSVVDERKLAGVPLPGLKIVRGSSKRVILEPVTAIKRLAEAGYPVTSTTVAPSTERPLIPLGQLEKMLGRKKLKEVLGELLHKPEGPLEVALESDPRPSVDEAGPSAEEDFAD